MQERAIKGKYRDFMVQNYNYFLTKTVFHKHKGTKFLLSASHGHKMRFDYTDGDADLDFMSRK